jgi:hypothetical protein
MNVSTFISPAIIRVSVYSTIAYATCFLALRRVRYTVLVTQQLTARTRQGHTPREKCE